LNFLRVLDGFIFGWVNGFTKYRLIQACLSTSLDPGSLSLLAPLPVWVNQIPHAGDRPPPPTPQLDRTRTLLPNRLESPSTHKLETAVSQAASGTLTEMAESPSTNERTPGPKQMRVATLADIAQTQMPMETTHFLTPGLAWAWLC
jgi:hypothetical protein